MTTANTRLYTLLSIGSIAAAACLSSLPAAAQYAENAAQAPVPQVIVTAKRMTAAERAAESEAAGATEQVHRVVIVAKRLRPAADAPIGVAARENPTARPL